MAKRGIAPPDLTTSLGQLRVMVDDIEYIPLDPAEEGFGDYRKFSDDELVTYLAVSGDSVFRAKGNIYLHWAGIAAAESKSVKDYDLSVDLSKRSADFRAVAQALFEQADDADDASGSRDIFDVVDITGAGDLIPEGTIPMYGRAYTWERIR